MKTKQRFLLSLCALSLIACGDSASPPSSTAAEPPAASQTAAPAASSKLFAKAPSCESYLSEYGACLESSKIMTSEGAQAARSGLDSTRAAWEMMDKNPMQSEALEAACKAALESLPQIKSQMDC